MSAITRLERISQLADMAESYPDKPHSTPEDWALLMAEIHEITGHMEAEVRSEAGEMVLSSIISRIATTHPEVLAAALTTTRDYFTERGYL